MDYTFATIVVPDADHAAAQKDYPNYFMVGLSADGSAPATFWVSSGPFSNVEMDNIVNEQVWAKRIYFGNNTQAVLTTLGLMPVQVPDPVVQPLQ